MRTKVIVIVAAALLALGALFALSADDGAELVRYDAEGLELERRHIEPRDPVFSCWTETEEECE